MTPQLYLAAITLTLIAALGGLVYYYHSKYESSVSDYKVLQSKNADLIAVVASDKVAVDKLAKDSQARENAAKQALAKAQKDFDEYVKKSQEFLLAQPSDVNLCTSANVLFNQYINQGVLK